MTKQFDSTSVDVATDVLMLADAQVRGTDVEKLEAILMWAAHTLNEGIDVKAYFKNLSGVELYWSASTWQARTSEARKVLRFYGGADASVSATMVALHAENDERTEHGEREAWGIQYWAQQAGHSVTRKASKVRTIAQDDVVSFVEACDDAATLSALAELVAVKLAELAAKPTVDRLAVLAVAA